MNATIRGLKGFLALCALACLGLLLRWVTDGSIAAATAHDLTAMASLAIGAVAWVAYCWLVLAVLATVLEQIPGAIGRAASLVATNITSHGSRALLRSALGVAAVTPLTIGLAHATPGQTPHHPHSSTTNPHTAHQQPSSPPHPWTSTEPRSTGPLTDGMQIGARPWSAVEPRSTVDVGGDSSSEWRATEAASTVQLTEQTSSTPPTASRTARAHQPQASDQSKTANHAPTTDTPAQRPHQQPRTGAPAAKQPPAKHTAVPVPDRPTAGAPTRYTHLQSGQVARPGSRVVKPDDSLWTIAAAELGPAASDDAIAARWPQWYAANRQLIGPDPNVIYPGQVLNPPPPSRPVPPTNQEK